MGGGYKKLTVWQKAKDVAVFVYRISEEEGEGRGARGKGQDRTQDREGEGQDKIQDARGDGEEDAPCCSL